MRKNYTKEFLKYTKNTAFGSLFTQMGVSIVRQTRIMISIIAPSKTLNLAQKLLTIGLSPGIKSRN